MHISLDKFIFSYKHQVLICQKSDPIRGRHGGLWAVLLLKNDCALARFHFFLRQSRLEPSPHPYPWLYSSSSQGWLPYLQRRRYHQEQQPRYHVWKWALSVQRGSEGILGWSWAVKSTERRTLQRHHHRAHWRLRRAKIQDRQSRWVRVSLWDKIKQSYWYCHKFNWLVCARLFRVPLWDTIKSLVLVFWYIQLIGLCKNIVYPMIKHRL